MKPISQRSSLPRTQDQVRGGRMLAFVDALGICRWIHPRAGGHMGWTSQWVVGQKLSELIHPDHLLSAPSGFGLDLWDSQAGQPTPMRAADGTYHWMAISVSPKRGTPGYKRVGLLLRFSPAVPPPHLSRRPLPE